jgi:hypothetical protein
MIAEGEDLYDDLYEDVGDMLLPKAPFQCFHEVRSRQVLYLVLYKEIAVFFIYNEWRLVVRNLCSSAVP